MRILDEMRCSACRKKLSETQSLFDTAWLGVYWCGSDRCAVKIMNDYTEEFDPEDECLQEDSQ